MLAFAKTIFGTGICSRRGACRLSIWRWRGDIYFNLISFVHCHHLENEQTRIFLDAYAEVSCFYPSTNKVMRMRVGLHLHEGLWGFTKAHNGFSDPYHTDWGAQHLNALREL